jgi:hypothetical protein
MCSNANQQEGVITPDLYEPEINHIYATILGLAVPL